MDSFRSMKLVRKCVDKNLAINIHVTFDKNKHLSEANIKRRNIVRDRLIGKERSIEQDEKKRKQDEEKQKIHERFAFLLFYILNYNNFPKTKDNSFSVF